MYLHLRMTSSAIFSGSDRSSSVFSLRRRTCGVLSFDGGSDVSKCGRLWLLLHCPPRLTRGGPCASSASRSLPRRRGGASLLSGAARFSAGLPVALARLSRAVRRNGCSVCVDRLGCPPRAHAARDQNGRCPARNALACYRRDASRHRLGGPGSGRRARSTLPCGAGGRGTSSWSLPGVGRARRRTAAPACAMGL